jgi:hypothetical protein
MIKLAHDLPERVTHRRQMLPQLAEHLIIATTV